MAKLDEVRYPAFESGHIYFFYRPKVGAGDEAESWEDVQRLHIVLKPFFDHKGQAAPMNRLLIVPKKKLPEIVGRKKAIYAGFVQKVSKNIEDVVEDLRKGEYQTATRGKRIVSAARPAGAGVYRILDHGLHTHLIYALEMPKEPAEVQEALNIAPEASYIIQIKNPEASTPAGAPARKPDYPPELLEVTKGYQFVPAKPVDLLNYEGAQFLLIGASLDIEEELGEQGRLTKEKAAQEAESIDDGDPTFLFDELRLHKKETPAEPLITGHWA